ncbi:MAG: Ni/Fe-hydrogenase cytochrome b subunit [Gammaproteobacteria bacterium]
MALSRRDFLKGVMAGGCSAATAGVSEEAEARPNHEMPPNAMGLLYDSTLCTGCKACVTACKQANDLPLEVPPDKPYLDPSKTLSEKCLNVIKVFTNGIPRTKDTEDDGFAFFKHSCMHCVDPACVSACPVQALRKNPSTGVVTYNADACIGCRYCIFSCPFRIPRFDYDNPFGAIHKCQLCDHLPARGKFSACADACPTGATLYGPVEKLKIEAKRRLALTPGEMTKFPRRSTETGDSSREQPAAKYIDRLYGEKEGGGTQMLMLSAVPFEKFGLPDLPERSFASISETIQHTLYRGLIAPALVLAGLAFTAFRRQTATAAAEEEIQDVDPSPLPEPRYAPVGGKLITPVTLVLALLAVTALVILGVRFVYGLGSVTHLNDGYTWGIWVVLDIVIGTAFACGGYATATLAYIFNKGQYHPLVRPALLASMFGYTLGGFAVFFDLGRWWNIWHTLWPGYFNINSVMFEVAACVALYILVMWIEFSPVFLEKFRLHGLREKLNRVMFFFVALGVLLPSMHQSSLGTLLIVAGDQVHPLWKTTLLPLLYVISAFTMGLSIVIFEASMTAEGFKRPRETRILGQMSTVIMGLLATFLIIRLTDIALRGEMSRIFAGDLMSLMFLLETALFLAPLVILISPSLRNSPRCLFVAAVAMLLAGSLYRVDSFLVAYHPGEQYSYFPSIPEMLVTVGVIAFEILAYIVLVRFLPVLRRVKHVRV